jgi:hypothetical protein
MEKSVIICKISKNEKWFYNKEVLEILKIKDLWYNVKKYKNKKFMFLPYCRDPAPLRGGLLRRDEVQPEKSSAQPGQSPPRSGAVSWWMMSSTQQCG